jgi:hypothetical protein
MTVRNKSARATWCHPTPPGFRSHRAALESTDPATGVRRKPPNAVEPSIGCRVALEGEGPSAFGPESGVLVVVIPVHEWKDLAIDNVGGFLLSLMDGATDVETVLDISNLPRPVARRHLRSMIERGIIVLRSEGELPVAPGACGDQRVATHDDGPPSSFESPALRGI